MAKIRAFRALRYDENIAGGLRDLCAPPYDIISPAEQDELYNRNPHNVIRLELTRGEDKYNQAKNTLKTWLKEGVLKQDERPALYLYEEEFSLPDGSRHVINGVISQVELREFSDNIILPHEETLSKAKADRFELMAHTFCNFSQIYSLYRDEKKEIRPRLDAVRAKKPDVEFAFYDGIIHRLWLISDETDISALCKAFEEKQLFIADGHHRYETALSFKKKLTEDGYIKDAGHAGNFIMMMLVDMEHEGLVIFPTHRLLANLENYNEAAVLEKLREHFEITALDGLPPEDALRVPAEHKKMVYIGQSGNYLLTFTDSAALARVFPEGSEAYRQLDVNLLHGLILEPLFGIDKANMAAQKNLTYTRDAKEAVDGVAAGKYQCAFLLEATLVGEIRDVSLHNEKMPQKSTYFYPKLITGLVMNKLMDIPE